MKHFLKQFFFSAYHRLQFFKRFSTRYHCEQTNRGTSFAPCSNHPNTLSTNGEHVKVSPGDEQSHIAFADEMSQPHDGLICSSADHPFSSYPAMSFHAVQEDEATTKPMNPSTMADSIDKSTVLDPTEKEKVIDG